VESEERNTSVEGDIAQEVGNLRDEYNKLRRKWYERSLMLERPIEILER
jgi:hypothetical protein